MTTYKLEWVAADGQGFLNMGDEFETREAAEATVSAALDELLGQGGTDEDEGEILAGGFTVSNQHESWDVGADIHSARAEAYKEDAAA